VQVIFAGKAHPADREGKEVMKAIVGFCQASETRRHAAFVEDYDLVVARYLVQGVDVWLNTPRRGLEASGTSGMKVLPNGGLNLSILDGWWVEGYEPGAGGRSARARSTRTSRTRTPSSRAPSTTCSRRTWCRSSTSAAPTGCPGMDPAHEAVDDAAHAAVRHEPHAVEYAERYYEPAARCWDRVSTNDLAGARQLAAFREHLQASWSEVRIEAVETAGSGAHRVGEGLSLTATVRLGAIDPAHVAVEAYYGPLTPTRQIREGRAARLTAAGSTAPGVHPLPRQRAVREERHAGLQHPRAADHPDACELLGTGLISWWQP